MNQPAHDATAKPFQFTIRTAMSVMTGVAAIVSLSAWDAEIGGALSVSVVGS